MTVLIPPFWAGCYAFLRYQKNYGTLRNFGGATLFIYSLVKVGLYSSENDMERLYRELYTKYQHEARLPKYRGLKLAGVKTPQQADQREFTSGNFDQLKALIHQQRGK